jgi:hypothetical protein
VRFEIGLWDGKAYAGRLPRSGELIWDGHGRPHPELVARQASPTPSPTASPAGLDLTALDQACAAIPSGQMPTYLQIKTMLSYPPAADPRTHALVRRVSALTAASLFDVHTPYAVAAVVVRTGHTSATGQARPIDRAGEVQLWTYSDGAARHKGIRTFANGRWTMVQGAAADALTFAIGDLGVSYYWTGLNAGDRFGFVTAASTGCGTAGLDANLQPLEQAR